MVVKFFVTLCKKRLKLLRSHNIEIMFHRKIKNRILIVEKVIYRSHTGQTLGLTIHNHLKSRIHLCWSNETGTPKYKDALSGRSFEKRIGCVFVKH